LARHAQPREVAELKGATRQNPQRYRKETPKSAQPLGQAPVHLSDSAKGVWFEIESLAPAGVLTGADRFALEILAELLAEWRDSPREFAVGKYTHLIGCLARLGMSPADRQKLGMEKAKEGNPFDDF
jgi:phage terminase small subunit